MNPNWLYYAKTAILKFLNNKYFHRIELYVNIYKKELTSKWPGFLYFCCRQFRFHYCLNLIL